MTANITEEQLINRLATDFAAIDGITATYGFAQNPDTLTAAQLPAVLFVPGGFESDLHAHHNFYKNEIEIVAVLFVVARQSAGGKLRYIENRAIPFLGKIRTKFQTQSVVKALLSIGLTKAFPFSGTYGAGGTFLTHNGIEYIGVVTRFSFTEVT